MKLTIVKANMEHARKLAPNLRDADRAEVEALGFSPSAALEEGVALSLEAWTALADGEPVAMFGVTGDMLTGVGSPWLLTGQNLPERAFLRECKPWAAKLRQTFPTLFNYVDDRYVTSHKWLTWLGFRLHEPEVLGPNGQKFRRFDIGVH